jgi:hypothetical protein
MTADRKPRPSLLTRALDAAAESAAERASRDGVLVATISRGPLAELRITQRYMRSGAWLWLKLWKRQTESTPWVPATDGAGRLKYFALPEPEWPALEIVLRRVITAQHTERQDAKAAVGRVLERSPARQVG